ncbi:hypothetical protein P8C59_001359 [Phyllachora maydis]|uniref:Uncharacterized protein n=1 Tax=Phyllachora maydis TaxID=1825666 RepID=A0AAD9M8Z9_9PEZI|nr:hypothetical protein P8C59_001359 [Phyllachora maydis]
MPSPLSLRGLASTVLVPTARLTTRQLLPPLGPSAAPFSTTRRTPAAGEAKKAGKEKKAKKAGSGLNRSGAAAGPSAGGGRRGSSSSSSSKGGREAPRDPKIVNMLRHMARLSPRLVPAPLRMARNRHLRHWTIHRAWLLLRRQRRDARETALARQHNSMRKACEALRTTAGPGTRAEGYLFRVAMQKHGVYGLGGVPIEYARPQTETPAREPWNHGWKR